MEDMLKVQAVRQGISLARFEILQGLGIALGDAPLFKDYKIEELQNLRELGLGGDEIVRYYRRGSDRWNDGSFHGLDEYARVRKTYSEDEIVALKPSVWDLEAAIKNGLSKEEVWRASTDGVGLYDFAKAKSLDVSYKDLQTATDGNWSIDSYLKARSHGFSQTELREFMQLFEPYTHFSIEGYVWLRLDADTFHSQVVEMMDATAGMQGAREYYLKYRKADVSHDRAMELTKFYVYPDRYFQAIREASHEEVLDAVRAGVSLDVYATLRANNCRIKHHEIIEYRYVSKHGIEHGINSYLKLLDAGIAYESVLPLTKAGFSLYEISRLVGKEYGLHPGQVLRINESGLTVNQYLALREGGMTHEQVIEATRRAQPDIDISD